MMGYGYYSGFGFGWIFTLMWWILIIFLISSVIRMFLGGRHHDWYRHQLADKSPLDILKERYAKGEITKKEFDEMKKDIA